MKKFKFYNIQDYKIKEQDEAFMFALDFTDCWEFEQIINNCVRIQFDRPANIFVDIDDEIPNRDKIVHIISNLIVEHLV